MLYDILEHDQMGTMIYDTVEMPFTADEDGDGWFTNSDGLEIDIEDFIDEYLTKLTKETLNAFTTTHYTMQPQGQL